MELCNIFGVYHVHIFGPIECHTAEGRMAQEVIWSQSQHFHYKTFLLFNLKEIISNPNTSCNIDYLPKWILQHESIALSVVFNCQTGHIYVQWADLFL